MATYLLLQRHSAHGRRRFRDSPEWRDRGIELLEQLGGAVLGEYYGTIGAFDAVWVVDLPDVATVEQARLTVEREGTCRVRAYPVFGREEYRRILEDVVA